MKKSLLIGFFTLLFGFNVLWSQETQTSEQKTAKESQSSQEEQVAKKNNVVVVVSATRGLEKDTLDIPQAVSTVNRKELDSTVFADVDDVLHRLPNVGFAPGAASFGGTNGNTTSSYWAEGFSIRGLGNQRVLVMTDGIRQSGQGVGYGGGNLSLYDLYSIDHIDVVRGPGSVLYGTDAFGGVVNVVTRSPKRRESFGMNSQVSYSGDSAWNFNRAGGYVDAGNEDWAFVAGGSYTQAGKPNLPHGNVADSGNYNRAGGWIKFDCFLSEDARLRFLANVTKNTDISIANRIVAGPLSPAPFIFDIPLYERAQIGAELLLEDISPKVEHAEVGVYYQQIRRKGSKTSALFVGGGPPRLDQAVVDTNETVRTYEIQPQVRLDFDPHTITVGMDLGYDDTYLPESQINRVFFNPIPFPPVGTVTSRTTRVRADARQYRVGAYAQDNWECDPFEIVLGGRLDYFNVKDTVSGTSDDPFGPSGSIGLLYHYNPEISFYANLATGFRVPDLNERYQNTVIPFHGTVTVLGTPNLNPERNYTFEVGTKARYEKIEYEFAAFVNQVDDFIGLRQTSFTVFTPTYTYANLGGVLLYGVEGDVKFFPVKNWEFFVNGGRTYTKNSDKLAIPDWAFNYGTAYNFYPTIKYIGILRPEINARSVTRAYDSLNNMYFGGFTVLNAQVRIGLDLWNKNKGSFVLGVSNILNKEYNEPFMTLMQPGRGVFGSVTLDF